MAKMGGHVDNPCTSIWEKQPRLYCWAAMHKWSLAIFREWAARLEGMLVNVLELFFWINWAAHAWRALLGPGCSRPGLIARGFFHSGLPSKGGHMEDLGGALLSIRGGHAAPHHVL